MRGAQNENLTTALVSGENLARVPRRRGYFWCGWRSVRSSCCCLPLLSLFFPLCSLSTRCDARLASAGGNAWLPRESAMWHFRAHSNTQPRTTLCGPQWHTVVEEKTWGSFKVKISSWNSNGNSDDDYRHPRRSLFIAFVLWAIRCARRWNNVSWKSSGKSFCNNDHSSTW